MSFRRKISGIEYGESLQKSKLGCLMQVLRLFLTLLVSNQPEGRRILNPFKKNKPFQVTKNGLLLLFFFYEKRMKKGWGRGSRWERKSDNILSSFCLVVQICCIL